MITDFPLFNYCLKYQLEAFDEDSLETNKKANDSRKLLTLKWFLIKGPEAQ